MTGNIRNKTIGMSEKHKNVRYEGRMAKLPCALG